MNTPPTIYRHCGGVASHLVPFYFIRYEIPDKIFISDKLVVEEKKILFPFFFFFKRNILMLTEQALLLLEDGS